MRSPQILVLATFFFFLLGTYCLPPARRRSVSNEIAHILPVEASLAPFFRVYARTPADEPNKPQENPQNTAQPDKPQDTAQNPPQDSPQQPAQNPSQDPPQDKPQDTEDDKEQDSKKSKEQDENDKKVDSKPKPTKPILSTGKIVAIVAGSFAAVITGIVLYCCWKKRKNGSYKNEMSLWESRSNREVDRDGVDDHRKAIRDRPSLLRDILNSITGKERKDKRRATPGEK
ncbi:hypothetical protein BJ508DRAFT_372488 [Ascobolus immersus RN42]|uniref:Mid2 domain-containing protein n=1 Tax=Ascobolus immersus RN42 TaxID=1160509 RepID=A0A3N4IM20_ASCIM|nr:hypothetical protein BJ508DRAFT_372488 [Ascobolus immersus RN42]